MAMGSALWRSAKQWRTIPLGPVAVLYRMRRNVRVSNNRRRRLLATAVNWFGRRHDDARIAPATPPLTVRSAAIETAVIVGSTSGVVARPEPLTLVVGKFGLRAMAHVLAREWGPLGIHVAHLIIDADIREDDAHGPEIPQADPNHPAELIHSIHLQPRSAWTSELDVRPWNEKFWEHC